MNAPGTMARAIAAALLVSLALVLQTSVFSQLAWRGVVPDVVLLVVVAAGLARGSHFAMVLGFGGGLLLDLAPPADHVAGRWALALMLVGYVAGQVRHETRPGVGQCLATVAACSFLGTSVFALTGLLLGDAGFGVSDLLRVVLAGVVWDVVIAAFVLPLTMRMLIRAEPHRALA